MLVYVSAGVGTQSLWTRMGYGLGFRIPRSMRTGRLPTLQWAISATRT